MIERRYLPLPTPWVRSGTSPSILLWSNAVIGLLFAVALVLGSWRDGTLRMIGPSFGLLEHPAIWIFVAAQILVPIVVSRSTGRFSTLDKEPGLPLTEAFITDTFPKLRETFFDMLKRDEIRAKRIFNVLLLLGLGFWSWNTFQNLRVGNGAPRFDFWDSAAHFWGYWLSRAYKLYIWLVVAPTVVHAQLSIARALRKMLGAADTAAALSLDPYHPDGAGGTRSFIDVVLLPMFVLVLPAVCLTTAATWVHKRYDFTTVGAIIATVTLFVLVYWYPATALRNAIVAEKDRQKRKISGLQRSLYDALLQEAPVATTLKDPTSVLLSLSSVAKQVDDLPNWPQLARVAQAAVVFVGSPLVAPLLKDASAYFLKTFA